MKPINIFFLTRLRDNQQLSVLEYHMSGRKRAVKIKSWEIDGLRRFSDRLAQSDPRTRNMSFFYSFQMPKIGKEFDLLRVDKNTVINIELKSEAVSDDQIKHQLEQNRYYLNALGKNIISYTYISSTDTLVRLSKGSNLVKAAWDQLSAALSKQEDIYRDNIEDLFREDQYLISPLTEPEKFLHSKYFLTLQQRDIRAHILHNISTGGFSIQSFTGLAGTGKSLLLYDIAMKLSQKQHVCIIYCGNWRQEIEKLDRRLKRIHFLPGNTSNEISFHAECAAICIDDGHNIKEEALRQILKYAREREIPVIISYDREDILSPEERRGGGAGLVDALEGAETYRLTDRIRVNKELSSFISHLIHQSPYGHSSPYPHVSVSFANAACTYDSYENGEKELEIMISYYLARGYVFIQGDGEKEAPAAEGITGGSDRGKNREYRKILMVIDNRFYYDQDGYLRSNKSHGESSSPVRSLFHGLSKAVEEIAIIVDNNPDVGEKILMMLKG